MYWKTVTTASLMALPAAIEAHADGFGGPKLVGLGTVEELRARTPLARRVAGPDPRPLPDPQPVASRKKRQNTNNRCGSGLGTCAAGYCCSSAGWCGQGIDYCAAPDCQFSYGSGCDTLKIPAGPNTNGVARTKVGSVAYGGAGIYSCTVPGTIAITYDDGPYDYTDHVLDLLDQYNAKATFFITGNNIGKGEIDDASKPWSRLIRRMASSNHQIASHTWGHQDLSVVSADMRKNQMYYNEMAFNNILGYFPTYMRPPYSSCNAACQTDLAALGYHIIYFDVDTEDYLYTAPGQTQVPKDDFKGNISVGNPSNSKWLAIAHDIHSNTAYSLTEFMLQTVQQLGYRAVTVGDCLGDPKANWYRTLGGTTPTPTTSPTPPSPTRVSTDGTCGGTNGFTCLGSTFGDCCSQYGWCDNTSDHCGAGCQAAFGACGFRTSVDGTCGGLTRNTCAGSAFGNCCSSSGWCGSTTAYCGSGCQNGFGTCS